MCVCVCILVLQRAACFYLSFNYLPDSTFGRCDVCIPFFYHCRASSSFHSACCLRSWSATLSYSGFRFIFWTHVSRSFCFFQRVNVLNVNFFLIRIRWMSVSNASHHWFEEIFEGLYFFAIVTKAHCFILAIKEAFQGFSTRSLQSIVSFLIKRLFLFVETQGTAQDTHGRKRKAFVW